MAGRHSIHDGEQVGSVTGRPASARGTIIVSLGPARGGERVHVGGCQRKLG
jgi:hypothetical protein